MLLIKVNQLIYPFDLGYKSRALVKEYTVTM